MALAILVSAARSGLGSVAEVGRTEGKHMAFILAHFEIDDYAAWKRERFDQDPAGRKQSAKNHVIARGVDDPS
jgi:hypothetical protein